MERSIVPSIRRVDARYVDRLGFAVRQQVYGIALNAIARLLQGHMTLNLKSCIAKVSITTISERAAAGMCDALAPDLHLLSLPESGAELTVRGRKLVFTIETVDLASLRANINSYLRLADASYRCLTL